MRYIFRYLEIFSYMRYICSRALIYEVHHTTLSRDILQTPGRSHIRTFNVYTRSLPWELRMRDESNCQKHCKSQSVSVASRIYAFSVHTDQFVSLDICLPLLSLGAYDHPSTSGKRQFNLSVRRTIHIIYESRKTQFIEEKNDKMHISLQKEHGDGYKC